MPEYNSPIFAGKIRELPHPIEYSLILCCYIMEIKWGGKGMRTFNYSVIKEQKWDLNILGLVATIYKEASK